MVMMNRVVGSTTSTDVEHIELIGTPGESLAGLSIIVVESDAGSSNGNIDFRLDLPDTASIGDTGFFLIGTDLVATTYGVTPDLLINANSIEEFQLHDCDRRNGVDFRGHGRRRGHRDRCGGRVGWRGW